MTRGAELEGVRLSGRTKGWPNWTTPDEVLDVVRSINTIALDPCSNEASKVNAHCSLHEHGEDLSWPFLANDKGLVYVNPPYNQARAFVSKCIYEGEMGLEIILCVAARTDTRWAHDCFRSATALCFWGPGRIKFGNPPPESAGDAPSIPSMFVYWGPQCSVFMGAFHPHGQCFDLRRARATQSFPVQPLKVLP